MSKLVTFLVAAIVGLAAITAAGPTVIAIAHAAVPLVVAVGAIIALLRIVWHFTSRY